MFIPQNEITKKREKVAAPLQSASNFNSILPSVLSSALNHQNKGLAVTPFIALDNLGKKNRYKVETNKKFMNRNETSALKFRFIISLYLIHFYLNLKNKKILGSNRRVFSHAF